MAPFITQVNTTPSCQNFLFEETFKFKILRNVHQSLHGLFRCKFSKMSERILNLIRKIKQRKYINVRKILDMICIAFIFVFLLYLSKMIENPAISTWPRILVINDINLHNQKWYCWNPWKIITFSFSYVQQRWINVCQN